MGLREAILNAPDLPLREVLVPEWPEAGGKVQLRGLSGIDKDSWETSLFRDGVDGKRELHTTNIRARLVVRCLVDEKGERVFRDDEADLVGEKNGRVLDRLYDVARELSGLDQDAKATAKN